jgi:hypothetical protein
MSDISLNFTGLFVVVGVGLFAGLLATPFIWRFTWGLALWRRALLSLLAPLGLAGLGGAAATLYWHNTELAAWAVGTTLLAQLVALPLLSIFTRK